MKIRRDSWLAWVYFWGHRRITTPVAPETVSLCDLVAYVFIGLPAVLVLLAALFVMLWPVILLRRHQTRPAGSLRVIAAWIIAKKRGVCPLIEWIDTPDLRGR